MIGFINKTIEFLFSPRQVKQVEVRVHPRQEDLNALRERVLADQESWAAIAPQKAALCHQFAEKKRQLEAVQGRIAPFMNLFAEASEEECDCWSHQYHGVASQLEQQILVSTDLELHTETKKLGIKGWAQRRMGRPTWKERRIQSIRAERLGFLEALKDLDYGLQVIQLRKLELELLPIFEIEMRMQVTAMALAKLEEECAAF